MKGLCLLFLVSFALVQGENKYSEKANSIKTFPNDPDIAMKNVKKPFRMSKLNLVWAKAVVRLTEPKLKSLFSELKMQDKDELVFKKIKSEGLDKEGLKEAELRRSLMNIMSNYGLLEHFEDVKDLNKPKDYVHSQDDSYLNKHLFNDKKLNRLWDKAEMSGFTREELEALKEEFMHHQEKVDQYYSLLKEVEEGDREADMNSVNDKLEMHNEIPLDYKSPNQDYLLKTKNLREKHQEIRDDYDRLYRIAVKGRDMEEFIEPKVQGLWRLAQNANFTAPELESIRTELLHYEKRLLKLRHLHADQLIAEEARKKGKIKDKTSEDEITEDMIKKQSFKLSKLHNDIEKKIMNRHSEL